MTGNNVRKAAQDMRSQDPETRKGGAKFMAQYRAQNPRPKKDGVKPKPKPAAKKKP